MTPEPAGEMIVYRTDDGRTQIESMLLMARSRLTQAETAEFLIPASRTSTSTFRHRGRRGESGNYLLSGSSS